MVIEVEISKTTEITNLDEAGEVILWLQSRVDELEKIEEGLVEDFNNLCDEYDTMVDYYTTDPVVILDEKQWHICWRAMCKRIGGAPSWCDYPKYLAHGVVHADSANYPEQNIYDGIEVWFETPEDAMAFKLEWS